MGLKKSLTPVLSHFSQQRKKLLPSITSAATKATRTSSPALFPRAPLMLPLVLQHKGLPEQFLLYVWTSSDRHVLSSRSASHKGCEGRGIMGPVKLKKKKRKKDSFGNTCEQPPRLDGHGTLLTVFKGAADGKATDPMLCSLTVFYTNSILLLIKGKKLLHTI